MAKADLSIDPRILHCAKEEFLRCGFEKASLKSICQQAKVTTGALYNRYRGKEDLFCAVVADAVKEIDAVVQERCSIDVTALSDEELIQAWKMDEESMLWWFRLLYRHQESFTLLLSRADGTRYANFPHDLVDRLTQGTWRYYEEARRRRLFTSNLTREEMHILLTAFWSTIYEPFIHGMKWEQIASHSTFVCRLFNWYSVLGLQDRS